MDGVLNWPEQFSFIGSVNFVNTMTGCSPAGYYSYGGSIIYTTDGGTNWTRQQDNFVWSGPGRWSMVRSLFMLDENNGWAVGEVVILMKPCRSFISHTSNGGVTSIMDKYSIVNNSPETAHLLQNHPNHFNPLTKIKFSLPKPESVKIEVYNIIGQKIEILLNKPMPAGYHEVEFNGQNLSSGVYLYRIEAGTWQDVKKMLLVK